MAKKIGRVLSYFAVFDSAEEGGYDVSFLDFPGCVTFGKNFEDAREKAEEVLELWLEEMASRKWKIKIRKRMPIIDEIRVALPEKMF